MQSYKSIDKKWESFGGFLETFKLLQGSNMGKLQLSFVDKKYKARQWSHLWMSKTKFLVVKSSKSLTQVGGNIVGLWEIELSITKTKTLDTLNSLESKTSNNGRNSNNNEKRFKGMVLSKNKHETQ